MTPMAGGDSQESSPSPPFRGKWHEQRTYHCYKPRWEDSNGAVAGTSVHQAQALKYQRKSPWMPSLRVAKLIYRLCDSKINETVPKQENVRAIPIWRNGTAPRPRSSFCGSANKMPYACDMRPAMNAHPNELKRADLVPAFSTRYMAIKKNGVYSTKFACALIRRRS